MISKIKRSWHQFYDLAVIWSFQTHLETIICGTQVSFRRPFTLNSPFLSKLPRTDWVGVPKLNLSPGAGNPRYATDYMKSTFTKGPFYRSTCTSTQTGLFYGNVSSPNYWNTPCVNSVTSTKWAAHKLHILMKFGLRL